MSASSLAAGPARPRSYFGVSRRRALSIAWSFLALGAIIGGCVAAMKYQEWRLSKMA